MLGPQPVGSFSNITVPSSWEEGRLVRGMRYRVNREFVDFDGDRHSVGEEWSFVASIFSPHDDLLLIGVRLMSGDEWKIHLHWTPETQQEVIENFLQYVVPVSAT
jgi:hypothetical protein